MNERVFRYRTLIEVMQQNKVDGWSSKHQYGNGMSRQSIYQFIKENVNWTSFETP